jgi:hypothetical protein
VINENNDREVPAEILSFKEGKMLSVSLNKSVKITLVWNGKIYEGKASGMTFVSTGPKITETKEGR